MADLEKLEVLVVDENPLVRFGVLSLVNLHPMLHVCGEAAEARSARALCAAKRPRIVVLNVDLPNGDGIEFVREFARMQPGCRHVFVSALCHGAIVQRAFDAGAHGYVSETDARAELVCAIEAALSGATYLSKTASRALESQAIHGRSSRALKLLGTLSDREMNVFRRMGEGQGTTAIAQELSRSVKTVETYHRRIKEKLHLIDGAELHRVAERWANFLVKTGSKSADTRAVAG